MATNAKRMVAPSGRWAIMARTGPTGPWVQVESVRGDEEADRMVRDLEDDEDDRINYYIGGALADGEDWGDDAPREKP